MQVLNAFKGEYEYWVVAGGVSAIHILYWIRQGSAQTKAIMTALIQEFSKILSA